MTTWKDGQGDRGRRAWALLVAGGGNAHQAELLEMIAGGLRVMRDEHHGSHDLPEELIQERARNIAAAILGTFSVALLPGEDVPSRQPGEMLGVR
jgi:hypothetical protein